MTRPLDGITVLDFTTLLPGPLCTLLLAEAGAIVLKIERPGTGDEMRRYHPRVGPDSAGFALLNRGKRSLVVDLKDPEALERVRTLVREADVVVEQFRPGVMDRLGLGYEALQALNPRLVYCAITGYGQDGPNANVAAHDLNYMAETGMLSLTAGADGSPVLPAGLIADIAGGAYPAMMNILLALRLRDLTGQGSKLDISMTDNLFPFLYSALAEGEVGGQWPTAGSSLVTGASPRYQVYRTADDRFVAAAPLEERFWQTFCAAIELSTEYVDDQRDPQGTRQAVAQRIATRTAAEWQGVFRGKDVCANVVSSVADAVASPHFQHRGLFARQVLTDAGAFTALPVPVAEAFRDPTSALGYPRLGEDSALVHEPVSPDAASSAEPEAAL
jgi:crotonobetainyl-CoA:carnitine CoA-transferase CaiB-like acyl-CoA transferase